MDENQAAEAYRQRQTTQIQPFFHEVGHAGTAEAADGIKLGYRLFSHPTPIGNVVLSTGRSENCLRYAEVAHALYEEGFSVVLYDIRGQGYSSRLLPDPMIGHVENFEDYVSDLKLIFDTVGFSQSAACNLLLAHSLGGLISAHFAAIHPNLVSGMALSAPMFGINLGGVPSWLVSLLTRTLSVLGKGGSYAPGQGPFDPRLAFEENTWTSCRHRFAQHMQNQINEPILNLGGTSCRWVAEALSATTNPEALGRRVLAPSLVFQAGRDVFVTAEAQNLFCKSSPNARLVRIEEGRHELFSETDTIVSEIIKTISAFFKAIAAHKSAIERKDPMRAAS